MIVLLFPALCIFVMHLFVLCVPLFTWQVTYQPTFAYINLLTVTPIFECRPANVMSKFNFEYDPHSGLVLKKRL